MASAKVTYGTLPGGSWIDPAAPRPPVGFRVRLPDTWTAVDLDPATSWEWVRSYVRERIDAAPELARHRGRMRRVLREFLDDCRAQGIFVMLLLAGPASDGPSGPEDLVGASLTLAWRRLAGTDHVDVDGIAQVLAGALPAPGEAADRIVAVVELPTGPAAYLHNAQLAALPGRPGQRRMTALSQFFVPIPGLPWLGVVTAATANLELADGIDSIAEGVASSIEFLHPAGDRSLASTDDHAGGQAGASG
jgi:hypothetical protein